MRVVIEWTTATVEPERIGERHTGNGGRRHNSCVKFSIRTFASGKTDLIPIAQLINLYSYFTRE
jgi:hypothetical protein